MYVSVDGCAFWLPNTLQQQRREKKWTNHSLLFNVSAVCTGCWSTWCFFNCSCFIHIWFNRNTFQASVEGILQLTDGAVVHKTSKELPYINASTAQLFRDRSEVIMWKPTQIELHAFCHPVSSWNLLTEEKPCCSLYLISNLVYLCLSFWKDSSAGLVEAEVQKGVFSHCEPRWPGTQETLRGG